MEVGTSAYYAWCNAAAVGGDGHGAKYEPQRQLLKQLTDRTIFSQLEA
jgi:hypothetical protein